MAALQRSTPHENVEQWLEGQEPSLSGEAPDGVWVGQDLRSSDARRSAAYPPVANGSTSMPNSHLRPVQGPPAALPESAGRKTPLGSQAQPPTTAKGSYGKLADGWPSGPIELAGRGGMQENQEQPVTAAVKDPASGGWRSRVTRTPLVGVAANPVSAAMASVGTARPAASDSNAKQAEQVDRAGVTPEVPGMSEGERVDSAAQSSGRHAARLACQWEPYEGTAGAQLHVSLNVHGIIELHSCCRVCKGHLCVYPSRSMLNHGCELLHILASGFKMRACSYNL